MIWEPTTLNCRGTLLDLETPVVMGILNVTEDSFSDGGKYTDVDAALQQVGRMLAEGAKIIDVGGQSSRPGAQTLTADAEWAQVQPHLKRLLAEFPEAFFSIDTYHAQVARKALDLGVHIVNDISAWEIDPDLLQVVIDYEVPYVLMHMQGQPSSMQKDPSYDHVVTDVMDFMIDKLRVLMERDVRDVIVDPGFGFGKTIDHNFQLLSDLNAFKILERPIMVGLSRKSMIGTVLDDLKRDRENGTSVLHTLALQNGAKILRAHNVANAMECIQLWRRYQQSNAPTQKE